MGCRELTQQTLSGHRVREPEGFRAHSRGDGRWYLEWNPVPGATGYQEDHEFSHGINPLSETRGTLFAVPNGDERTARVRTAGPGGSVSGWVKCTVNWRGMLTIENEDDPKPPGPPPVPVFSRAAAGQGYVSSAWDRDPEAFSWRVRLLDSDQSVLDQDDTDRPEALFTALMPYTQYGVQVRAIGASPQMVSRWSAVRWMRTEPEDPPNRPAKPRNLATHCITATSAQVTWNNDPSVDHWTSSVNDGPSETTYDNGRRLTGLTASTAYTVTVIAHRGELSSPEAEVCFSTLDGALEPPAPLPAPHDLVVRAVSATEVELSWSQDGKVSTWFASVEPDCQKRVDGRRHGRTVRFSGLVPGLEYTAEVYAQDGWKLSPITRQAVVLPEGA
ncbi:fibronectin type III domain-containing protein [Streptomyces sp. TR02-1]|uniref:fibronectin type III domain-containing protein n=1 Tax=Streptomyces sp. TR02-1 TaxID=3385977 RepID=UPI0039A20495